MLDFCRGGGTLTVMQLVTTPEPGAAGLLPDGDRISAGDAKSALPKATNNPLERVVHRVSFLG
jgi:hypothetical protein